MTVVLTFFTVLPFTESNKIKTRQFIAWLKCRKSVEDMEEHVTTDCDGTLNALVECPLSVDVTFKAGTSNMSHPGNASFRELLGTKCDDYFSAPTQAKKNVVVNSIFDFVQQSHGRFLEWDDIGCWKVMKDQRKIRIKIYNSLFYCRKMMESQRNMQSKASSTLVFLNQDGRKRKRDVEGSHDSSCCSI